MTTPIQESPGASTVPASVRPGRILTACCILFAANIMFAATSRAADYSTGPANPATVQTASAVTAAMNVLDEFMLAFNARNMSAWSETLNYPHVRFASGEVRVWQDIEEFSATPPFEALKEIGWDHSHWISRKVIMSSAAKVHIATVFQRFNSKNESIGQYESLYIVTRVGGRWGIQSRSSLAP